MISAPGTTGGTPSDNQIIGGVAEVGNPINALGGANLNCRRSGVCWSSTFWLFRLGRGVSQIEVGLSLRSPTLADVGTSKTRSDEDNLKVELQRKEQHYRHPILNSLYPSRCSSLIIIETNTGTFLCFISVDRHSARAKRWIDGRSCKPGRRRYWDCR